jgi:guanylate kinase
MVYEEHKGIPRSQVEEALKSGKDVVAKVDIQGAATLRRLYPQAVVIFLVPRTVDEWLNRLKRRNTETEEKLKTRIETAKYEVSQIDILITS